MSKSKSSPRKTGGLPKIASPAQRALAGAGISNLKQLTKFTKPELLQMHGIGQNAIKQLETALAEQGWSFRAEEKTGALK